jgi:hypothetical protein
MKKTHVYETDKHGNARRIEKGTRKELLLYKLEKLMKQKGGIKKTLLGYARKQSAKTLTGFIGSINQL